MPRSSSDFAQRYRLSDERASRVLARLDATAELVDAVGQTELVLELPGPHLVPVTRARLRFTVGQDFAEFQIEGEDPEAWGPAVYAAGPIERILAGLGFREVSRSVVIARRYALGAARIRVAHVDPIGWFCEIAPSDRLDLGAVVATIANGHGTTIEERRVVDRRATERRRERLNSTSGERRSPSERRVGDRRLGALS